MTTEIVVRSSKLAAVVDVASAYSIAYVAQLYVPVQAFAPSTLDVAASQAVGLACSLGFLSGLFLLPHCLKTKCSQLFSMLCRKNYPE